MLSAILLERSVDKVSPILFWLEISIHYDVQLPLQVCCAAGEQGHDMDDGSHVLMGAPTAYVTDAITYRRGGYYACSPAVHWPAPAAVS